MQYFFFINRTLDAKLLIYSDRVADGKEHKECNYYPSGLLEKNVSGYALCEFTIDKEGVILRPHILRSTHPEFAEEALRIVKGMPKWSPALVGGKPADSNYTGNIFFRSHRREMSRFLHLSSGKCL